jgi:hypothetical protein
VELNENGHGQTATVENKIFQGLLTRLYLVTDSDGQPARLYADIPSRRAAALEPGSAVRFHIDPSHVRIFPADEQPPVL